MLPDEVCPRSPLASALIIKNSFIDLEDEDSESESDRRRRSSSSPPSCRHSAYTDELLGFRSVRSKTDPEDNCSTASGGEGASGSDIPSEEPFSERSHQGSTELASPSAGLNPNAPVWNPSLSPASLPAPCMPCSTMNGPRAPQQMAFYQMPPSMSGLTQAFVEQQPAPPPPPPPLASSQPPPPQVYPEKQRGYPPPALHRLNANAKAWQPGAPMTNGMPMSNNALPAVPPPPPAPSPSLLASIPNSFRTQFEALLGATKEAVMTNSTVLGVDIFESTGRETPGMTVVAWQREDKGGKSREQIMKLAKDALLNGAGKSDSVYVMGYKNWNCGFEQRSGDANRCTAVLGGMFDESKACWDTFGLGCCRREWDCRWQHPTCKLPIEVEIRRARG